MQWGIGPHVGHQSVRGEVKRQKNARILKRGEKKKEKRKEKRKGIE